MARLFDPILIALVVIGVGLALLAGSPFRRGAGVARRARVGGRVAWVGWAVLWLLASPWMSNTLVAALEPAPIDLAGALAGVPRDHVVIVVLAGGMRDPSTGAAAQRIVSTVERLAGETLPRVIGAARVYRELDAGRVIVSGRADVEPAAALTEAMRDLLVELEVPADRIVLEADSHNTRENAERVAALVGERAGRAGDRVVLVTSALHLPRARAEFERAGVPVVPAPVDYQGPPGGGPGRVLPQTAALSRSQRVVHELLGRFRP